MRLQRGYLPLSIPYPDCVTHSFATRWQVLVFFFHWHLARGAWPIAAHRVQRDGSRYEPIYRFVQVGPVEFRRYRFATRGSAERLGL